MSTRTPLSACSRRSSWASCRAGRGCRPSGTWPPGSESAGRRSGARSTRWPRAAIWSRAADATAARSSPTSPRRSVLEPGAAAVAASRDLGPQARAGLRDRLDGVMSAGPGDYRQADSWLHLTLAELAGSPSLLVAVADVRVRVNELLDAIPLLPPNIEHSNDQHAAIVEAVLAGKPGQARRKMAEHLDGTAALLRGFLG